MGVFKKTQILQIHRFLLLQNKNHLQKHSRIRSCKAKANMATLSSSTVSIPTPKLTLSKPNKSNNLR